MPATASGQTSTAESGMSAASSTSANGFGRRAPVSSRSAMSGVSPTRTPSIQANRSMTKPWSQSRAVAPGVSQVPPVANRPTTRTCVPPPVDEPAASSTAVGTRTPMGTVTCRWGGTGPVSVLIAVHHQSARMPVRAHHGPRASPPGWSAQPSPPSIFRTARPRGSPGSRPAARAADSAPGVRGRQVPELRRRLGRLGGDELPGWRWPGAARRLGRLRGCWCRRRRRARAARAGAPTPAWGRGGRRPSRPANSTTGSTSHPCAGLAARATAGWWGSARRSSCAHHYVRDGPPDACTHRRCHRAPMGFGDGAHPGLGGGGGAIVLAGHDAGHPGPRAAPACLVASRFRHRTSAGVVLPLQASLEGRGPAAMREAPKGRATAGRAAVSRPS